MNSSYTCLNKIKTLFSLLLLSLLSISSSAHWSTKGPYGGSVSCFTVMDTILFAGTYTGGVYKSTNQQGTAWRYVNYTGLTNAHIHALTSIGKKLIAGTDSGVAVSADAGVTWLTHNHDLKNSTVQALVSTAEGKIYAGTNSGIYMSADSGNSWAEFSMNGFANGNITALVADGNELYAGTSTGVYYYVSGANTWYAVGNNLPEPNITSLVISAGTIYAGTTNGIYNTLISNPNWVAMNIGLATGRINNIALVSGALYASTNAGVFKNPLNFNWTSNNTGITADTINAVIGFGSKLFAGSLHGGIYSRNAASDTWAATNTGLNNLKTSALLCADTLLIFVGTEKGVYISRDLAASYKLSNNGLEDSTHVTDFAFKQGKLFATTANAGVFVSTDTGTTWTSFNSNLTDLSVKKIITTDYYTIVGTASGKFFKVPYTSGNWEDFSDNLTNGVNITALATDGATVLVGTSANGVFYTNGVNWSAASTGLTNMNITSLAVLNGKVFAGTNGNGVFVSDIDNVSWSAASTGLPSMNITSLGATGNYVLAGYKGGVYATYDEGTSWVSPNVLLYIPAYSDVPLMSFTAARIFVALPNNSVYSNAKSELPEAPNAIGDIAPELTCVTIMPNPAKGTFTINYNRAELKLQSATVYDITGRLLEQLPTTGNTYRLTYPQGVYLLHLHTNKGESTQKIVIE